MASRTWSEIISQRRQWLLAQNYECEWCGCLYRHDECPGFVSKEERDAKDAEWEQEKKDDQALHDAVGCNGSCSGSCNGSCNGDPSSHLGTSNVH